MVIGAVILAAGFGKRFGADKRLHILPRELDRDLPADAPPRCVAQATVAKYAEVFDRVRVVIRPDDDDLKDQLNAFNVEIVSAPLAHQGMGHSLAAGITGLTWTWAFVGLADMPFVQTGTLKTLYNVAKTNACAQIIRPCLGGHQANQMTHPVGWHQRHFTALATSSGDRGARALLKEAADNITEVLVADEGIIRDIDHPSDLVHG